MKHDDDCEMTEEGLGFVAKILDRSGREERGIGGGCLEAAAACGLMPVFSSMNWDIHSKSLDERYFSGVEVWPSNHIRLG